MIHFHLVFSGYRGEPLQIRPFRTYAAARARIRTHFEHAVIYENVWSWHIRRSDGVMIAMNRDCIAKSTLLKCD